MDGAAARGERVDEPLPEAVRVDDLLDHLEELESTVDSTEERREVQQAMRLALNLSDDSVLGARIQKYTTRDMAEAFVGAVIFSVPLLVEDGVFDIAGHFLRTSVAGIPVYLVANLAFIIVMTHGLIYWADLQNVQVSRPLFGVVPRRLVGVSAIAFLTAAAMMTLWGRVDGWGDPGVAFARITVVWTVAAFGAALGDILPGESAGEDINDLLDDLAE